MTATPPIRRARTTTPYQGGLRRTLLGIGGVYRPLSCGVEGRPTLDVVRPPADFPLFDAFPGPDFVLSGTAHEDTQPGPVAPFSEGTLPLSWEPGSWSSTTTTPSSTTWSRSWASSEPIPSSSATTPSTWRASGRSGPTPSSSPPGRAAPKTEASPWRHLTSWP